MTTRRAKPVALEDFVPYDRSLRWRLHDAYYAACGRAAWSDGAIPFYASSNFGIARQHADLFVAAVAELERTRALGPRAKVWVLEVGSGSGAFAAAFLRALRVACGEPGRRVLKRLRWILSDYASHTVKEAAEGDELRADVEAGTVVPAIFDLTRPGELKTLEGEPIDAPLTAVFANYVCCVAPLKIVRKVEDGTEEQYLRIAIEADDEASGRERFEQLVDQPTAPDLMKALHVEIQWRPVALEQVFKDPLHSKVIRAAWDDFSVASLPYPYTFVEMLGAVRSRLVAGGLVLVNDYGNSGTDDLRLTSRRMPQHYGNAINHGVEFVLFDALAPLLGFAIERTHDTLRAVHTAVLGKGRMTRGLRETFRRTHVVRSDGEDLLDFSNAARRLFREGIHSTAARLYERCLVLDPDSLELLYRAGEACLEAESCERALTLLARGAELDGREQYDFHFLIGRARHRLGQYGEALAAYAHSNVRSPQARTYVNAGISYEALGDASSAAITYQTALEIDPTHKHARRLLDALQPPQAPGPKKPVRARRK